MSKKSTYYRKNARLGYLFTSPWLIGFIIFTMFPLFFSLYMSFNDVSITGSGISMDYVGLSNFQYALVYDFDFITKLLESLKTIVIVTPLVIILAMMLAILLNQDIKFRALFRAIYFLPVIILSGSLYTILESNNVFGIIDVSSNSILKWIESSNLDIIYQITNFLVSNIFTVLWFSGVQILIYLSGLQKISKEIYEAASIDGANAWQKFWKITLPSLKQLTIINIVYTIVSLATFSASSMMLLISSSMHGSQAHQGFGYASAIAWLYFIVIIIVLGSYVFIIAHEKKKRR